MKACLLALWSDSLTYTIAKAVSFAGHELTVFVADAERDATSSWSLSRRIAANPRLAVVNAIEALPAVRFDTLIVQGHPLLLGHGQILDRLAPMAERITAVSIGDRSRWYPEALKLQWQELRWYGRWLKKVSRVVYKDGFFPVDFVSLFRSRRVVGFDAHSKFLQDPALFDLIHAATWDAEAARPIRANFLGSRDPAIRTRILDSVQTYFTRDAPSADLATPCKEMCWHAYSDSQPAALSPERFLGILGMSDFTLSPPGYSLATHRPIEALLCGSVPVLNADELDIYDLGLTDGATCIAVARGGWPAAMERILAVRDDEVAAMRRNIRRILPERVAYPALARSISERLGLGAAA